MWHNNPRCASLFIFINSWEVTREYSTSHSLSSPPIRDFLIEQMNKYLPYTFVGRYQCNEIITSHIDKSCQRSKTALYFFKNKLYETDLFWKRDNQQNKKHDPCVPLLYHSNKIAKTSISWWKKKYPVYHHPSPRKPWTFVKDLHNSIAIIYVIYQVFIFLRIVRMKS